MSSPGAEDQSLVEVWWATSRRIDTRNSMLYNVLPMAVQSRIPGLASLRQLVSQFRSQGAQHRKSSSTSSEVEMARPETPPPKYRSREGSGSNTPVRQPSLAMTPADRDSALEGDVDTGDGSEVYLATLPSTYEATSGLEWSFAKHGLSMVNSARHFAKGAVQSDPQTRDTLVRRLYIDGLRYLISGLPSDLTANEVKGLQAVMPEALVTVRTHEGVLRPRSQQQVVSAGRPTLLHRATAWTVCYTMLLMTFILPYVQLLLGIAHQYEKEHRVGRRLLESSTIAAAGLGRRGLQTAHRVFQWNDGMVGEAVNRAIIYGTAGVCGGLRQGIEDACRAGAFSERRAVSGG